LALYLLRLALLFCLNSFLKRGGNKMRKMLILSVVAGIIFAMSGLASASSLLFDRGLPTANLNNAAGVSRSNVAWGFGPVSGGQWLAGDDFSIGGTGEYLVDFIRIWSTNSEGLTVYFGEAGEQLKGYNPLLTETIAAGYQGSSGTFRDLYQYDVNLNSVLSGADTYQFFLGGPVPAYIHSSNAALSGSNQQGADDTMLWAWTGTGTGFVAADDIGTWTSLGNGWDKASDANIQVYGAPVPEPGTIALLGLGMTGLAIYGKRRQKKA
jgi:hypothetical protein